MFQKSSKVVTLDSILNLGGKSTTKDNLKKVIKEDLKLKEEIHENNIIKQKKKKITKTKNTISNQHHEEIQEIKVKKYGDGHDILWIQ